MVQIGRRIVMLSLLALPLLAVTITAAQSVPSLFVGTVTNGSGQPVADAQVVGKVGGEFCGQGTSSADGSYGLAIPDMTTRPAACSDPGAQVSIFINGTLNDVAPIGKPGVPTQRNVNADATPSATPTPAKSDSLFTLAFNGEPTPGGQRCGGHRRERNGGGDRGGVREPVRPRRARDLDVRRR